MLPSSPEGVLWESYGSPCRVQKPIPISLTLFGTFKSSVPRHSTSDGNLTSCIAEASPTPLLPSAVPSALAVRSAWAVPFAQGPLDARERAPSAPALVAREIAPAAFGSGVRLRAAANTTDEQKDCISLPIFYTYVCTRMRICTLKLTSEKHERSRETPDLT